MTHSTSPASESNDDGLPQQSSSVQVQQVSSLRSRWVTVISIGNLLLTAVTICAVAFLLPRSGRVEPQVVTRSLVVQSSKGNKRAVIGATADGGIEFSIGSDSEAPDFLFHATEEGTELTMGGANGQVLLRSRDGASEIVLLNEQQRPRLRLAAQRETTSMFFIGDDLKPRAAYVVSEQGAQLTMLDRSGVPRVGVGLSSKGPAVVLQDGESIPRVAVAVAEDTPRISVRDAEGVLRLSLSQQRESAALMLSDPSGQPTQNVQFNGIDWEMIQPPSADQATAPQSNSLADPAVLLGTASKGPNATHNFQPSLGVQ